MLNFFNLRRHKEVNSNRTKTLPDISMAGEHERAMLQRATLYRPNIVVYTALGDSYKALRKTAEAEQSYSYHMVYEP